MTHRNKNAVHEEEKKMDDTTTAADNTITINNDNNIKQDEKESTTVTRSDTTTATTGITNNDNNIETDDNKRNEKSNNIMLSEKTRRHRPANNNRIVQIMLQIMFLDLPVFITFTVFICTVGLEYIADKYLIPQVQLAEFSYAKQDTDITYYHRICDVNDQTAFDTTEFTYDNNNNMTTDDAVQMMLKHGVTIIPDLLSIETATKLREFIINENKKNTTELIYVIENNQRWSFPITVDQHITVINALEEMLNKQYLINIIESVVGTNPAIIEFTAITSAYGAVGQYWHQDVVPEGNAAKYGRNFVPSYSLFVPLQNVTAEMGATGICPGTHMCSAGCDEFCATSGFQVSGKDNNWPLGYGALVNQQTTHRGEAHTDPNAPERVVFILTFAPRPLSLPQTVETRLIGFQGSYSLHWLQWGHTLYDFQRPTERMQQPWRALRSMGLYKPRGRQWGWDYISVISSRIINHDTGYQDEDLDDILQKQPFWWLPKSLYGGRHADTDSSEAWVLFFRETVKNAHDALFNLHKIVVATCVVLSISIAAVRRHSVAASFGKYTSRLIFIHACVLIIAYTARQNVDNSSWGRNIRAKRTFNLLSTLAAAPNLPATLPTVDDIFIFEGMKSESMASFTQVLEVFHPGNNAWHKTVQRYAENYELFSQQMQQHVRQTLLQEIRQQGRRILVKNYEANWAEASNDIADRFCMKSLLSYTDPTRGFVMEHIDFLISEARYGYWRDTSMQKKHTIKFLFNLQDRILQMKKSNPSMKELTKPISVAKTKFHLVRKSPVEKLPAKLRQSVKHRVIQSLPNVSSKTVDYSDAWIQEGDVVEAVYGGDTIEWYRARVTNVNSNRMTWDVAYDDGDEEAGLCHSCIRPFVPYAEDEDIEVRVDEETFVSGRILAVYPNDQYDIWVDESRKVLNKVDGMDLRRVSDYEDVGEIVVGARVYALYPGAGDEWFSGTVVAINYDGTAAIQYDDGDYIPRIPLDYISIG